LRISSPLRIVTADPIDSMPHWGGIIPTHNCGLVAYVKIPARGGRTRSPRARVYMDIQQLNVGDKLLSSNRRKP
jgi:hypothetical protein